MNEFIKPKVRVTVGIGPQGTVYHESRAVVGGERNRNNISVSKTKNVSDNIDALKVLAKSSVIPFDNCSFCSFVAPPSSWVIFILITGIFKSF